MSVSRITVAPPSRASWPLAAAILVLACAVMGAAAMVLVQPEPQPYEPPPWHRIEQRVAALEQSVLTLDRRVSIIEMAWRRPTGSPTGSTVVPPTGSPIGDSAE